MENPTSQHLPEFARIRLFVPDDLRLGAAVGLTHDQGHYLLKVMRLRPGEEFRLFNGRDGEWRARIALSGRAVSAEALERLRTQTAVPKVTLAFAPIKKSPMEYLVQKATELGVKRLQPIFTERTQIRQINQERVRAQAIEAAEQSWRLSIPELLAPISLNDFLDTQSDRLLFCDERSAANAREGALETLMRQAASDEAWTILIGPEGGFSAEEQARIEGIANAVTISLGPRIVRAETAAVMALTLWQAAIGDLKRS